MGHKKTIKKLKNKSNNITFDEVASLLEWLGYEQINKGKTSGSRVKFMKPDGTPIYLHKPHPRKSLLSYQIDMVLEALKGSI